MPIERTKATKTAVTDDMDAVMVNALAALGDLISHYQDLVAQEAYLGTAGERRSVAGRQKAAVKLRRHFENLKVLLDQLETVISNE